jgi:hypothetical protein
MAPHLDGESYRVLTEYLKKTSVFLEFGAGGSTFLALHTGVNEVHSVESDLVFLSSISKRVYSLGLAPKFHPHPIDIGPTGEWGAPKSRDFASTWFLYPLKVWYELIFSQSSPDLILIDGRFRVSCFLASLVLAKKGATILFDDYYERSYYHVVESFIKPSLRVGRLAVFEKTNRSSLSCLIYMLLHLGDFR